MTEFYAKGKDRSAGSLLNNSGYGWPLVVTGESEFRQVKRIAAQHNFSYEVVEKETLKCRDDGGQAMIRYSLEFSSQTARNTVSTRLQRESATA